MAFVLGAVAFAIAIPVLAMAGGTWGAPSTVWEAPEPVGTAVEKVAGSLPEGVRPMLVAIGANESRHWIVDKAAQLARLEKIPLKVVHVREPGSSPTRPIAPETTTSARALVAEQLDRVAATTELAARGLVLYSVGDQEEVGRVLAKHIDHVDARAIAIRRSAAGVATVRGMLDQPSTSAYNIVLLDEGLAELPLV